MRENNESGDQEVKAEGKPLRKPRSTSKASASKASASKAEVPKAEVPDSEINDVRDIRGNERETCIPAFSADKSSAENVDQTVKEDLAEKECREEEAKNTVRDVTEGETKKKNAGKRKLCKLVKKDFLKKHYKEYEELVLNPGYICGKCGRAAKDAKSLCKPMPID